MKMQKQQRHALNRKHNTLIACSCHSFAETDPEISKRGVALCQPAWLPNEENFRFQVVQKCQSNIRNYKFLAKYFYQYFQILIIFIYNESFLMKSYKFFKIGKRIDKEREKTLMQKSMRKEKLRNVKLCFITGCFIKSFNMIINHFFISQAHSQPNFCFLISGWRKKYQKGKLGTANSQEWQITIFISKIISIVQ